MAQKRRHLIGPFVCREGPRVDTFVPSVQRPPHITFIAPFVSDSQPHPSRKAARDQTSDAAPLNTVCCRPLSLQNLILRETRPAAWRPRYAAHGTMAVAGSSQDKLCAAVGPTSEALNARRDRVLSASQRYAINMMFLGKHHYCTFRVHFRNWILEE